MISHEYESHIEEASMRGVFGSAVVCCVLVVAGCDAGAEEPSGSEEEESAPMSVPSSTSEEGPGTKSDESAEGEPAADQREQRAGGADATPDERVDCTEPHVASPGGTWIAGTVEGRDAMVFVAMRDELGVDGAGEGDGGAGNCADRATYRFEPGLWTYGTSIDDAEEPPLVGRRSELLDGVEVGDLAWDRAVPGESPPRVTGRLERADGTSFRFAFEPSSGTVAFPGRERGLADEPSTDDSFPLKVSDAGSIGAAPVVCERGPRTMVWHASQRGIPVHQAPTTSAPTLGTIDVEKGKAIDFSTRDGVTYTRPTVWEVAEPRSQSTDAGNPEDEGRLPEDGLERLRDDFEGIEPGDRIAKYDTDFYGGEGFFRMYYDGEFVSAPNPNPPARLVRGRDVEWWVTASMPSGTGWIRLSDYPVKTSGGFGCEKVLFE